MIRRYILSLFLIILSAHLVAAQDTTPTPSPTLDPVMVFLPVYSFSAGDQVSVRTPPGDNLRLRTAPASQAEIVVNMENGLVATITGTPERLDLFDEDGNKLGSEYWYPLRVSSDTEGWALGARNGVAFLIPLPESSGLSTANCDAALPQRLTVGEKARVLPDSVANLYVSPFGLTLHVELAGLEIVDVIGRPVCGPRNNYYYFARYEDFEGWIEETDRSRYVVEPYDPKADTADDAAVCPTRVKQQLQIGMLAQVNPTRSQPIKVRTRPTMTGLDAYYLNPGETVEIVAGPLCYQRSGGAFLDNWWRVQNERGVQGWAQETNGTIYFLLPYDPANITPTPTIDADCVVTMLAGVNLRNGAGGTFEVVGSAAADTAFGADAQAVADDGVVWWRLQTGGWVASNLTAESGNCTALPLVGEGLSTPTAEPNGIHVTPSPASATPTPTPNTGCVLTALQGVNLRSGPGSEYEIGGSAAAESVLYADGQFAGTDSLRWWRLAQRQPDAGTWVREDFVREGEGCATLPTVQP